MKKKKLSFDITWQISSISNLIQYYFECRMTQIKEKLGSICILWYMCIYLHVVWIWNDHNNLRLFPEVFEFQQALSVDADHRLLPRHKVDTERGEGQHNLIVLQSQGQTLRSFVQHLQTRPRKTRPSSYSIHTGSTNTLTLSMLLSF